MLFSFKRLLLIAMGTALLVSCSDSSDLESRYEASVESLSSFLAKHGETKSNHYIFKIVLDRLQATPVDALNDREVVFAGLNAERSVLVLYWVGADPYIEVRISDASNQVTLWMWPLMLMSWVQRQRSIEKPIVRLS